MKEIYENLINEKEYVIAEKDKTITSQLKTIEEYDEKLCLLVANESKDGVPCKRLRNYNATDMFKMKPRKNIKGSSGNLQNLQILTCDGPRESSNVSEQHVRNV